MLSNTVGIKGRSISPQGAVASFCTGLLHPSHVPLLAECARIRDAREEARGACHGTSTPSHHVEKDSDPED